MLIDKIRNSLLKKFLPIDRPYHIPEEKHIRMMVEFIRSFCTYNGSRLYYRAHEVNIRILDMVTCSVNMGGEIISAVYPLTEYKDAYEVKELLDDKIRETCSRNYNIYSFMAKDLGVIDSDISHTADFTNMIIKSRSGKEVQLDITSVRESSIKLFRDQVKIVY